MIAVKDGAMTKVAENKVASAVNKVVRTTQDDYVLACSGGLFFASYDWRQKKFIKQDDFFLSDHLVT